MATSRWRLWGVVLGLLVVVLLSAGCAELDQLRARNLQLDNELKTAQGRIAQLEAKNADLKAALAEREDDLKAARLEVDLWKGKFETLQEAFQRLGKAPGISPELEAELRRIALVDPNIRVKQTQEGFVVEVGTDILFDSGKIDLKPEGRATIKKIAEVIKKVGTDELLRIDGHTDNEPIKVSGWKDNWHLSAMRAHTVLKALQAEGIAPERMYLAGFAFYRPEASNDTPEGRRRNRRVEILIVPKMAVSTIPSPAAPEP